MAGDESDDFDVTEDEFDARMAVAEPARLVDRDERVSLYPLGGPEAFRALLHAPRTEVDVRIDNVRFNEQSGLTLETETIGRKVSIS
jgi:hypothetical protein